MKDFYLHARVNKDEKDMAEGILKELGTNLSAVTNMLIKQIIMTRGIPFSVLITPTKDELEKDSNLRTLEHNILDKNKSTGILLNSESEDINMSYEDTTDIDNFNESFKQMSEHIKKDDKEFDGSKDFGNLDLFQEDSGK